MKKVTKVLVSMLVIASIAACGANPRPGRSNLSNDAAKQAALGRSNVDAANTDLYQFTAGAVGGAVLPATTLAQKYLVDLSVLGLGTDANTLVTTAAYLEVGIAVEKTTGLCGMYVIVDDYQYGTESTPAFTGTESIYNTTTNVTCVASDAYSKLMITIGPGADATHAIVTIMDTYNGQFFMQMSSFAINPQVN
jgi:hypothetical protein